MDSVIISSTEPHGSDTPEYAEVIVPLSLHATFTYIVPPAMRGRVSKGSRVVVQFGARRFYTAIVVAVSNVNPAPNLELKTITELLDSRPILRRPQLQLWEWLADYYLCSIGDVYRAALPAGLKVESDTFVELSPEYLADPADFTLCSDNEAIVTQQLAHNGRRTSLADLAKATGLPAIASLVASMMERGIVIVAEKLVERYRSVREPFVRLLANRGSAAENARLFAAVKGAKKQENALMALIEMSGFNRPDSSELKEVSRKALCERSGATTAIVAAMAKKGIIEVYNKEVSRFSYTPAATTPPPRLSEAQRDALDQVHRSWIDRDVTLLHGVTSSGKTEVYIHIIDYVLKQGRQVLFLVPEIALTTQLTTRLQRVFGDKVVIYHSKFSDNERVEIWRRLLDSHDPCVVVGARSAVFLPFAHLGLVIVDEEHETSYKQQDPAPRYNGRDTAIVLAKLHGAKTLLGSATPTVETSHKARTGRFGLVELKERFGGVELPSIEIVDLKQAREKKQLDGTFAHRTTELVNDALSQGKQAIVFLNRRGYAPIAECKHCAWIPKCNDCDVTLTYHRSRNRLVCHYCGAEQPLPTVCPNCHEPGIEVHGYGTERIEEAIGEAFSHRRVSRMDLDTTRAKNGYDKIIDEFSQGKSDILVGTQMVTKGLDFDNVAVVAVVNADSMLNMPDFKASERAFNMLEQVAGRAGRRDTPGKVVIQTRQPDHPVLQCVRAHDYETFYETELADRRQYNYPPFTRLINVYVRHRDQAAAERLAEAYGKLLRHLFGNRVQGPDAPPVGRVQTYYIRKLMIKFELNVSMKKVKDLLRESYVKLHDSGLEGAKSVAITYDVDPG